MKGSTYFLMLVMAIMLFTVAFSFTLGSFSSKVLPVAFGIIGLFLCSIQLAKELKRPGTGAAAKAPPEPRESLPGYLLNVAWMVGFVVAIYVLGMIAAVTLFVLAYMKWLGARWRIAIISAVIVPVVIYVLFQLVLEIDLPWGMLAPVLGK